MGSHTTFHPEHHHAPQQAPAKLGKSALVLMAIGLVSLVAGLMMEGHGDRTRGIILVNLVYFMGVAMGGCVLAVVMQITWARWGRPIKRIAESFIVVMPILWLILVLFLLALGGFGIYEWYTHPEELHGHKQIYLTAPFFGVRMIGGIGFLSLLGLLFFRNSLRPDLGIAAETLGDKAPSWWGQITAGWKGSETETADSKRRNHILAPIFLMLFALIWSMVAFDLVMSLAPHWYANMFGAWYFSASFWLGLIWVGMISLACRGWMGIEKLVTPTLYHDLGKLVFAFTIFWTYLFFSQLLAIWYGNMTEEIGFLLVRLALPPWQNLSKVVITMCFFIPFATLLSRGLKKMPLGFFSILVVVAVGIWLDFYLLIMPSIWKSTTLPLGPIEIGVTAGFLGLFLYTVQRVLSSVPPVALTDECMYPDPRFMHVHPQDEDAAK